MDSKLGWLMNLELKKNPFGWLCRYQIVFLGNAKYVFETNIFLGLGNIEC